MNTSNSIFRSITIPATGTAILLLIPLIAMQFTDEVVWTFVDFAVAGVLLFGTGLTYMLVTRSSGSIAYRIAIGFALFTGLLLIWVNLAVGIIGTESNPANTMYFGVFFIGIIGALIARFRAKGDDIHDDRDGCRCGPCCRHCADHRYAACTGKLSHPHPGSERVFYHAVCRFGTYVPVFRRGTRGFGVTR
jgi:hypothetical protein